MPQFNFDAARKIREMMEARGTTGLFHCLPRRERFKGPTLTYSFQPSEELLPFLHPPIERDPEIDTGDRLTRPLNSVISECDLRRVHDGDFYLLGLKPIALGLVVVNVNTVTDLDRFLDERPKPLAIVKTRPDGDPNRAHLYYAADPKEGEYPLLPRLLRGLSGVSRLYDLVGC